jgi:hypothetical protein
MLLAAIALISLWRLCTGEPGYLVQVDFSIDPELFSGAEVVIDGQPVGRLQPSGPRNLTAFRVEEGEHTVELRREGYSSEPTRFTAGFGGGGPLIADLDSRRVDGEYRVVMVLRR